MKGKISLQSSTGWFLDSTQQEVIWYNWWSPFIDLPSSPLGLKESAKMHIVGVVIIQSSLFQNVLEFAM